MALQHFRPETSIQFLILGYNTQVSRIVLSEEGLWTKRPQSHEYYLQMIWKHFAPQNLVIYYLRLI